MNWRVILEQDEETGEWAAWCPELKGCVSAGATREEAIENIKEAIALYLEPLPIETPPGAVELKVAV
ncbi:MAG: type II toxin-antitoxin system HicB family antitoxin [Armatimonadetes bacterium]|nr:type II toxin-antitoxin system HicB family antitoxin [Armatimonadota bacterium]